MKLESVRWPECCGSSRLCARNKSEIINVQTSNSSYGILVNPLFSQRYVFKVKKINFVPYAVRTSLMLTFRLQLSHYALTNAIICVCLFYLIFYLFIIIIIIFLNPRKNEGGKK